MISRTDRAYGPEDLTAIYRTFDESWAVISGNYRQETRDDARERLAMALLSIAAVGWIDVGSLKLDALKAMALSHGPVASEAALPRDRMAGHI